MTRPGRNTPIKEAIVLTSGLRRIGAGVAGVDWSLSEKRGDGLRAVGHPQAESQSGSPNHNYTGVIIYSV